nr:replication factor A protein 1-like [Ipomoea batatas]
MAPMYIVVREIKKNKTSAAMKLRVVRTYDVLQSRGSEEIKSRECVFHDHESFTSLKIVDPTVLVDVIGRVMEIYSPLDKLVSSRHSRLIDFHIEDLNGHQLKYTVWDHHVEKVMPHFRKDFVEPVIVLIQMGRVKISENFAEVKITSSYDATQLLFNGDSTEFLEFRESLILQQTPIKSITSNSAYSHGNSSGGDLSSSKMCIITISDIFQKREVGEFWVPAQIIGIESDVNDIYESCKAQGCNKNVELNKGMFECSKCNSRYDECIYRYKIKVRVVDVKGTTPFLLWDREALDLVSVKADEVIEMQPKVMIKIPKELKTMVGRGLFFNINVKKDQLDNLSHAIPVMQVKHFPGLFNTYCPGLLDDNYDCLSSKLQLTDNGSDSDEVKEEAKSPNVNAMKEPSVHVTENEAVKRSLLDQFSSTQTSKKKKHVVVKEEKELDDKET